MKKYSKKLLLPFPFLAGVIVLVLLQFALAEGLGAIGGGIITFIVLPFLLIYAAILTYMIYKKNRQAKELLQKIALIDNAWNPCFLKQNIETTFSKIQEARMKRDYNIARDYLSPALFEKYKEQMEDMIREHRRPVLDAILLLESRIVQVADYTDDSKDMMWVHIKGSMVEYLIDDRTLEVISGNTDEAETFTQLWKFVRGPKGWVLDEVDQSVSISDFNNFYSFTEND